MPWSIESKGTEKSKRRKKVTLPHSGTNRDHPGNDQCCLSRIARPVTVEEQASKKIAGTFAAFPPFLFEPSPQHQSSRIVYEKINSERYGGGDVCVFEEQEDEQFFFTEEEVSKRNRRGTAKPAQARC